MMKQPNPLAAASVLALLVATAGPGFAQGGAGKPPTNPGNNAQAVGAEALALFERVCIAALARRQPAESVANAELGGSPRVPAERLRVNGPVRETAGWRVQGQRGRHTVMMLEPGEQCAVYTEGVDPDAFLDGAQALMQRADALPGWMRQGQPSRSASPRPFGMLTYVRARYTSVLPPVGKPPPSGPVPLPVANLIASAANRTDGRPNTAVITTDIEVTPR
ncbi:hypothetical protein AAFN86_14200 [Roseomonas sp. CAU 1739]|uniref:hypothetical protein n=1 Tax=Roseomonas sp. CAU 1739 TaxID=3140364 RepID=UPI00325B2073